MQYLTQVQFLILIFDFSTQERDWDTSLLSKGPQQFYHKESIILA